MPRYLIYRMKNAPRENFRWAPHTGGLAVVKPKDYDSAGEMEAGNPYELWKLLGTKGRPLQPGDLLETVDLAVESAASVPPSPSTSTHELWITKYIGFEPARWFAPDPPPPPPDEVTAISSGGKSEDPDIHPAESRGEPAQESKILS